MLNINNLSFAYKKDGEKILDDITVNISKGQMVAVLGTNGAGKSTMFKCILKFLREYDGEIILGGKNIKEMDRKELAKLAAYIPQSEIPVFNYTVFDSVLMGTTGTLSIFDSPGEEQMNIAREALESLGIEYMQDKGINELSGGERQLTLLARAMAQKASLLIMDEPTANLDYGNQQLVLGKVKNMTKKGYTVLVSTHNPEHVLQYATHVLAIKDHKIIASGRTEDVLTEELIEEIYGLKVIISEIQINGKTVKSCVPYYLD